MVQGLPEVLAHGVGLLGAPVVGGGVLGVAQQDGVAPRVYHRQERKDEEQGSHADEGEKYQGQTSIFRR